MTRELPLGLLMFYGYRATEDRVVAALEKAGFRDITRAQGRLLAGMDDGGTRVVTLAERARVSKQTAVSLIDRLEEAGYVRRTIDPQDRRARLVQFTERSLAMLPIARAEEQRIDQEWRAALGPARERRLREALEVVAALVDPQ